MNKHIGFLILCVAFTFVTSAQYCIPEYSIGTNDDDYIDGFELNTISNLESGGGDGSGYSDFTAFSTTLFPGNTYSIHLVNTPSFGEYYRAWIDYNQDLTFSSTEEIFIGFALDAGDETTVSFTVPITATPGETRLRVRCVYGTLDFDACSSETYGEAEDYTINILGLPNDLSILSIGDIPDACDLSDEEIISVVIKNYGTEDASGFTASYRINGGDVVTEVIAGTLPAGNLYNLNFDMTADLSADGAYIIESWINYDADEFSGNDSNSITVNNTITYLTTGFPSNVCYGGGTVFPSPLAGGGIWTGVGIINATTGELDPDLVGGVGTSTEITYLFNAEEIYTVTEIPFSPFFLIDPIEVPLGDDAFLNDIEIGFDFTYFDNVYDELYISSNGFVGFSGPSASYTVHHFPNPEIPNNIIAFCWTDLNPGAGGTIQYEVQGIAPFRRFIVEFNNVPHYGGTGTVHGQIVLYETSNVIDFHNTEILSDGGSMTQGIENIDGTIAFVADEIYNDNAFTMAETAWRYAVTPCDGSVTETINFIAAPTVEIDDVSVCEGITITLDAGAGAENYIWNTGETSQTIEVNTSGEYWVLYYANITCFSADTSNVIIHPLPIINLGADGIICEGTMLDAGNTGADYLWSNGNTSQTIFIAESGTYFVEVTIPDTDCKNSDTIHIEITPLPVSAFTSEVIGGLTIAFTNSSTDANTYLWDFGDGTISYEENPWHTFPYSGTWPVTLIATNDCGADIFTNSFQLTTLLENSDINKQLSVYPNPANDVLFVAIPNISNQGNLYIYNAQGVLLQNSSVHSLETIRINTELLAPGAYLVVLQQANDIFSLPAIIAR